MDEKGFSLLETVLVLSLVVVIAAIIIPAANGFTRVMYNIQIEGAAKTIASDIRWVQQATINRGITHDYELNFIKSASQYYSINDRLKQIKRVYFNRNIGFNNVKLTSGPKVISFTPNGAPEYSGTIIIEHTKAYPKLMREITVLPATGRVMVK